MLLGVNHQVSPVVGPGPGLVTVSEAVAGPGAGAVRAHQISHKYVNMMVADAGRRAR